MVGTQQMVKGINHDSLEKTFTNLPLTQILAKSMSLADIYIILKSTILDPVDKYLFCSNSQ